MYNFSIKITYITGKHGLVLNHISQNQGLMYHHKWYGTGDSLTGD